MLGVLGKLAVLVMILITIALSVLLVTREDAVVVEDGDAIESKEVVEAEAKEVDKKEELERLEKFLDGDRSEEQLKGAVGVSTAAGPVEDLAKKVKDSAGEEAVDLQKFLEEEADTFEKDIEKFADGETDLDQEVMWRIIGDWIYFRISFSPYDEQTHQLMQGGEEAVYMSFVDAGGDRLVPASAAARIPMSSLYVRQSEGQPFAWSFNGKLALREVKGATVKKSHVGWIFSSDLAGHLKRLKQLRAANAAAGGGEISSR